jgi:glycylpeptide N-tetradecanoyltransferase
MDEVNLQKLLESLSTTTASAPKKNHRFWNTQPVQVSVEEDLQDGPIEAEHTEIRPTPFTLPAPYEFCTVDLAVQLDAVYELLRDNYVEDVDEEFRFEYSREFLKWALMPPGYCKEWHVGVRRVMVLSEVDNKKDDKEDNNTLTTQTTLTNNLVAFIAAIPCGFRVRKSDFSESVEVNFLCVSKSLRSKRLAPMLIREVTRRVNLQGIFQAIYTAGIQLPGPCYCAQYYHRPLRVQELIKTGFCPPGVIEYPLGSSPIKLRCMQRDDLPAVRLLLNEYLGKFELAALFSGQEDAGHWLMPHEGVMYSYVSEDGSAFVSFYSIPTSVLSLESPLKQLQVAYLSYYAVRDELQVLPLIKAALKEAHQQGFHVFNALDVMDNTAAVLETLRFGAGDGQLRYYLYNWRTRAFEANQVGFIML